MKHLILSIGLFFCIQSGFSQSYNIVYKILNTKCSNASCHSTTSGNTLQFDGTSSAVYAAITNQIPTNSASAAKGDLVVKVNQPYESYLLKKCGSMFDTDLALAGNEGAAMKDINGNSLSNNEIEFIRQWIMNGAKSTGTTIDTALINAYYNDVNRPTFIPKPAAAGANEKVLRFGPVFIPATGGNEREYCLKHELDLPFDAEVTNLSGKMNTQSHHFLLFKFWDSLEAAKMPDGMRRIVLGGSTSFDGNKDLMAAWQDDADFNLPTGTAIFWKGKTWLDFNYHVKNYGSSPVLPCDFYFSVKYNKHDSTSKTIEMKSNLINNGFDLYMNPVAPGVSSRYFEDMDNGTAETRYLWTISSHTHKYGTGFYIFKKGAIPDTIYNGYYSYESGYNKGLYDWEHPTVRHFSNLLPINMATEGINCWTQWNNTGTTPVRFGFTTNDEMQLFYYMYTSELPTVNQIEQINESAFNFIVYPNPLKGKGVIAFDLSTSADVGISIMDLNGKEIYSQATARYSKGKQTISIAEFSEKASAGIYFATVSVNGLKAVQKFIVAE